MDFAIKYNDVYRRYFTGEKRIIEKHLEIFLISGQSLSDSEISVRIFDGNVADIETVPWQVIIFAALPLSMKDWC